MPVRQHSRQLAPTSAPLLPAPFGSGSMNHHRNFCAHQQPFPLTQKVEEAAMPGQPDARGFRFPRQFTLENYRSAAGFTAIIVRLRSEGPTFSVNPPAAPCCVPQHKKISTLCRNWDASTSLWNPEEKGYQPEVFCARCLIF